MDSISGQYFSSTLVTLQRRRNRDVGGALTDVAELFDKRLFCLGEVISFFLQIGWRVDIRMNTAELQA